MRIDNRLRRLEHLTIGDYDDVMTLIKARKYYDELTAEQKERYVAYRYPYIKSHERFEEIYTFFAVPEAPYNFPFTAEELKEILHFKLEYREPCVKTISEETRREVEELISHEETAEEKEERQQKETYYRRLYEERTRDI